MKRETKLPADNEIRAWVIVGGLRYPPVKRASDVRRGYRGDTPPAPLTAQRFHWLPVHRGK